MMAVPFFGIADVSRAGAAGRCCAPNVPCVAAPPLWARFYEIGTNKPLFADRDGVAKYDLEDIGYERRNGYAWYGTWPAKLLSDEYPAWKTRVAGGK